MRFAVCGKKLKFKKIRDENKEVPGSCNSDDLSTIYIWAADQSFLGQMELSYR